MAAVAALYSMLWAPDVSAQAGPCTAPANEIVVENCLPGSPSSEWDVSGAGDPNLQGFTTDISVNQGQTVRFKIRSDSTLYRLDIYRMGWYGGDGARRVTSFLPQTPTSFQPNCDGDSTTGLIDCGNWSESATWTVPANAVSGIYFAKLVRTGVSSGSSHVFFVVRDDDGASDMLFQTSDTTWQAYNEFGGNSLYVGSPAGRAYKVSYNRPFTTRAYADEDWVFNAEYPMVRWLERNGYDVSYSTGVDSHRRGAELLEHDTFLSVGHDEYWSGGQRANVEAARAAGVNLAFFSGNEVFWKTRWESSIDGSGTANRTLVTYKETHANAKIDPEPGVWTGTWRDPRFSPPADGGRPENALTGQLFTVNDGATTAIEVPAADGRMRFWRDTSIASLGAGQKATLPHGTLGYEWDEDVDNGHRPPGSFRMSTTTVDPAPVIQDHGSNYGPGVATHHLTLYKHASGALVFGSGTVQWPWGLDSQHDRGSNPADVRMQQATVNLFADMGVQPATLQADLAAASGSTDTTAPTSSIVSPTNGATVQLGNQITITGNAADGEVGGEVAGVEVSTDNGQTWHPATGRASWSYDWTPTGQTGTVTLRTRAVDDSGNLGAVSPGVTVEVIDPPPGACPCSIFEPQARAANANVNDGQPLEVGVKFRSTEDGYITGLRFYKGSANGGTHVGHLWSANGEKLAQATFTNESPSGWQQVTLRAPVPVARNTTYVASYHSSDGGYAVDDPFFLNGVDNPPLRALRDGEDGGNGVYRYGASGFPSDTYGASNYWVDVVFERTVAPDTTLPQMSAVTPDDGSSGADPETVVTATFNEPMDRTTVNGTTFRLSDPSGALVPADVSYDVGSQTATLTPQVRLEHSATYTATVTGGQGGVTDNAGNALAQTRTWSFTVKPPPPCPCHIFGPNATPAQPDVNDGTPVEVGVKFRADVDGFVTGLRFYKGPANGGTHVGHLWSRGGQKLAEATFTGETAAGWQQVFFSSPVAITRGITYVASYHSSSGGYALDEPFFGTAVDNPPLRALASGVDGGNGVYRYGESGFPTHTFGASNYWVDVVFERDVGPDTKSPIVTGTYPAAGSRKALSTTKVSATFNEPLDPSTVDTSTFRLRDDGGNVVPATVSYDVAESTAVLTPSQPLGFTRRYTASVIGGAGGVADRSGNRLSQDHTWSFDTGPPPPPPPAEGPGGPILAITSGGDPFSVYNAEILRAEGLNEFTVADLNTVNAQTLAAHDVVVLGQMTLTDAQVTMLSDWVQSGGNLIAMRPDKKLAALLGLTDAGTTLSEAYMRVDTGSRPGTGVTGQTMQFHGAADRYALNGAHAVASLYSNSSTATANPAVTLRSVGSQGGQAAAFTYDLARSVVYTRQGNPAWSGQERDGFAPIRSDDLFFGAAANDPGPDWVDFDRVAVPQADEQQRLLANLVTDMTLDRTPLPRFWYLPRGEKAAVVMTGDDHATGGTTGQFDSFKAASPPGCSVDDWECVRGTSYIYDNSPFGDTELAAYQTDGFELALHVNTGCDNFTLAQLNQNFDDQLATFSSRWPSIEAPTTNRTHCIAFSDWSSTPKASLAHGIRLDTNYYYWPQSWVQDRPGLFTGSGMPMRFADTDGTMIDVYQATTQLTDESGQNLPLHIRTLIDNAYGPQGYYGVFTANMHTDHSEHAGANAIVAESVARGVPVITARQLLEWLDGRNASAFEAVDYDAGQLSFTLDRAAGARGLEAMVPASAADGPLASLTRNGSPVSYAFRAVKGVRYAVFSAEPGAYVAGYAIDVTGPSISGRSATARPDGTATVTWQTNEPSTSRVDYGTGPGSLGSSASDPALVNDHSIELSGLNPGTIYHYRVTSADEAGNSSTSPAPPATPAAFGTPASVVDSTVAHLNGGVRSGTYVGASGDGADGEVQLNPAVGEELEGPLLPPAWSATPWNSGGAGMIVSGGLSVDGARAGTDAAFGFPRSLEFVATLGSGPFRHVGFGDDLNGAPWSIFSTGGGALDTGLYARTAGDGSTNTAIPGVPPTSPQRYRIEWTATGAQYFVNGAQVASHSNAIAAAMRPLASDYAIGEGDVRVHWLRMSPYATAGTFTSRVLDGGGTVDWTRLDPSRTLPAGTQIGFETRSGPSATPDGSWSAWQPAAANGDVASPDGHYLQYRATLTTGSVQRTPTLESVRAEYVAGP